MRWLLADALAWFGSGGGRPTRAVRPEIELLEGRLVLSRRMVGLPVPEADVAVLTQTDSIPLMLTRDQQRRIDQLVSVFENDTPNIQYAYIEALRDGRGYTAGRAGFTSATGDMLDVVQRYVDQVPGSPLAAYLPRLRQLAARHSDSLRGLAGLPAAWQQAADDPVFRSVQDQVVEATYFGPAVARAQALGLRTPLGLAILYDTIIQHGEGNDPDGLPALIKRTNKRLRGSPATGLDEGLWLRTFLRIRRADLRNPSNEETRREWSNSVPRVDVLAGLLAQGNHNLDGPIAIPGGHYTPWTLP